MTGSDLQLRRKLSFRKGEQRLILIKKPVESARHVMMKALLWALYLPDYPEIRVEVPVGGKYKPDLVETGPEGPRFWAEAGSVGTEKLRRLLKRFPRTHFALAVWGTGLDPLENRVRRCLAALQRKAPVDLIRFPPDAARHFVDEKGNLDLRHEDVEWRRIGGSRA